jgi:3-oxoadipate enol-lactonase
VPALERKSANIYYRDTRNGDPVILLHEYFGTGESWNGQRHVLARGYRVITPDLRGHGRSMVSPDVRLTVSTHADDILAIMNSLEIKSAHVAGCSLGAIIAMRIAQSEPERVRSLVLTGVPDIEHPGSQSYGAEYAGNVFPKIETALSRLHGAGDFGYARQLLLRNFIDDLHEKPVDHAGTFQAADAIRAATLLISGELDGVFSPQSAIDLSRRMPAASVAVLPATGHLVHLEMPGLTTELMLDHLARLETRGPC